MRPLVNSQSEDYLQGNGAHPAAGFVHNGGSTLPIWSVIRVYASGRRCFLESEYRRAAQRAHVQIAVGGDQLVIPAGRHGRLED